VKNFGEGNVSKFSIAGILVVSLLMIACSSSSESSPGRDPMAAYRDVLNKESLEIRMSIGGLNAGNPLEAVFVKKDGLRYAKTDDQEWLITNGVEFQRESPGGWFSAGPADPTTMDLAFDSIGIFGSQTAVSIESLGEDFVDGEQAERFSTRPVVASAASRLDYWLSRDGDLIQLVLSPTPGSADPSSEVRMRFLTTPTTEVPNPSPVEGTTSQAAFPLPFSDPYGQ
jgi:hypothetical protein